MSSDSSITTSQKAAPTNSEALINAWMESTRCSSFHNGEQINPRTSKNYFFIWQQWTRFIARKHPKASAIDAIFSAQATQVISFLNHEISSIRSKDKPSLITKRRYYRVISRIYDYAATQGWIKESPTRQIHPVDVPPQERNKGATLTPLQWKACICSLDAHTETAIDIRNKAVAYLLLHAGLTPQEIRFLQMKDIGFASNGDSQHFSMKLQIQAKRSTHQLREVTLGADAAQAMRAWLTVRKELEIIKSLPFDVDNQQEAPLFVTKKSPRLSMLNMLSISKSFIAESCSKAGIDLPAQMGPQIIRNTCIVQWLNNGSPISEVVAKAGLKNGKGLYHLLDSLNEEARARVSPLNKKDK